MHLTFDITIERATDASDPSKEETFLTRFITFHTDYDWTHAAAQQYLPYLVGEQPGTIRLVFDRDRVIYHPIYLLDHSSRHWRTTPYNDRFDSGLFGFAYITREEVRRVAAVDAISQRLLRTTLAQIEKDIALMAAWSENELWRWTMHRHAEDLHLHSQPHVTAEDAIREAGDQVNWWVRGLLEAAQRQEETT